MNRQADVASGTHSVMRAVTNDLFRMMARMRYFEKALSDLWDRGLISGEMHVGIGEEAIVAGVLCQLRDGDALALDHRSTPPLVGRGVDLRSMILEMLGSEDGLCKGMGGHMHLLAPEKLAASSGIVGASGPLACGFALSAQNLRPGSIAVAFFGEGAMNQGQLMESFNLAVVWKLPVLFVCKDNGWAITTRSGTVTGGSLAKRAMSFGMPVSKVNGSKVRAVLPAAERAVMRARKGKGPSLILAQCHHPAGHFLGDPILRLFKDPVGEANTMAQPLLDAARRDDSAPVRSRIGGLIGIGRTIASMAAEQYVFSRDPLEDAASHLSKSEARQLARDARIEVKEAVESALAMAGVADNA
jgi:TPP-dependent pyruvate/acetoin dehydrogenase alpha subunit